MKQFQMKILYEVKSFSSKLLLISAVVLFSLMTLIGFVSSAYAYTRIEEVYGEILTKSIHSLKDSQDHSWQVVLFKDETSDGDFSVNLRLVGFPGAVEFDRNELLKIKTKTTSIFQCEDIFAKQPPSSNVAQYDIKEILPQLPINLSLFMDLPLKSKEQVYLEIPYVIVLEWQTLIIDK